ncbi:sensor histidine kinase [Fibrella forsythiae]|uniref:Sensor histidine kinase n=1 Tax=Fibrella forsythiae TaxID=2817061 RepID=A0ABS3JC36_9BACT|nr:sensor histidine kinase [Fibrella forsythiae]MBO0947573.1 sensor histidine kinase [Fibrella forsythiae]
MPAWSVSYLTLRLFLDGMLVMMALYGLLSYAQHRKEIYWQYALYIVCMVITFRIDDQSYTKADYLPGVNYTVTLLESLAFFLYIRFAILLMDMPVNDPWSHRLLTGMIWLLAAHLLLDTELWLVGTPAGIRSGLYVADRTLLAVGALLVVPRIIRLRQAVMVYFIIGSFCFVMGCLVALGVNYVPQLFTKQLTNALTFPVTYMEVGVVLEVLCFTMGMSLVNRQIESERLAVQAELIRQLQENQRRQQQLDRIRADIARDLHDDIGADLSSISMLSQAAERQVHKQPDQASATMKLIGGSARQVLKKMRQIVWSLTETPATSDVFAHRFSEVAHTLFEHQDVELTLDLLPLSVSDIISADVKREVFLVYKELLHNALRHAKARTIDVKLAVTDGTLTLTISDDGVGFVTDNQRLAGNGLTSLHQRARDLNGTLVIRSAPGSGTSVTLSCPVLTPVQEGTRVTSPA